MRLFYVTMQFPSSSETFASVEILSLIRAGASVSVHSLRPKAAEHPSLVQEGGLENLSCTHNSTQSLGHGLLVALRAPRVAAWMAGLIARSCRRNSGQLWRSLLLLPRVLELWKLVEQEKPDVVHLYWGHYPSLLGLLLLRENNPQVVTMSLNNYDLEMEYPLTARLASKVPLVWTISRANEPDLRRIGIENFQISYRGVDVRTGSKPSRPVRKHRLLVAARLVPLKRVAAALQVCHQLQERWPNTTLVVLGEGPERPAVERLAVDLALTSVVSFRGRVSQAEVFQEMGEAEVFILLSANPEERLPNVVKEAMLRRCLCVVSNSKGISELVVNAKTGFVVDANDIHAAAQRVEWIFSNPERAREMAEEAHRHIVKHFDIDQLTSERLDCWHKLVEKPPVCSDR